MTDLAAGFGCIAALALWKGTKERWFPALLGMLVIAICLKWADRVGFPSDWLVFTAGFMVLMAGASLLRWIDKRAVELGPEHLVSKLSAPPKPADPPQPEPLWCDHGDGHFIGPNEPYRFRTEEGKLYGARPDRTGNSGIVCLDCIQKSRKETEDSLKMWDKGRKKEYEWAHLSAAERDARRQEAKAIGFCPKCDEPLSPQGSCPVCFEYPDNPNAPQNQKAIE
jgi:hypothetical protein